MEIKNTYVAYCLDEALAMMDLEIQDLVAQIDHDDSQKTAAARSRYLTQLLGGPEAKDTPGQFADPAGRF